MKPVSLLIAEGALAGCWIIAQAAGGTNFDTTIAGTGAIAATSVLTWYIWHDVTRGRPSQLNAFKEITSEFGEALSRQQKHYERVIERQHADHREDRRELTAALSKLTNVITEDIKARREA